MRILICGVDGYIGWPLAIELMNLGHKVYGVDNMVRRKRVKRVRSASLTPIDAWPRRMGMLHDAWSVSVQTFRYFEDVVKACKPEVIVHLAEQPSAPWSMTPKGCMITHKENVLGTLNLIWTMIEHAPDAHLIKLGSMGEYGTPDIDIPEGKFTVTYRGRSATLPFPKQPGSWYHLTKVHDSHNIEFACRNYGLRATDIMQGIVFGVRTNNSITRFDYDEYFGTTINRFCTQAVAGLPITPYGSGLQTRGFLPLRDSVECIIRTIDNPPELGQYRVFNQFAKTYSIIDLAGEVYRAAKFMGLKPKVQHIENPRLEKERHYYNPDHDNLRQLGYHPDWCIEIELQRLLEDLLPHREKVRPEVISPTTTWRYEREHGETNSTDSRNNETAAD